MSDQEQNPKGEDKDPLTKAAERFWGGVAYLMGKISTHEEFQRTHNIFHSDAPPPSSGHGLPEKKVEPAKEAHGKKTGNAK